MTISASGRLGFELLQIVPETDTERFANKDARFRRGEQYSIAVDLNNYPVNCMS